MTAVFLVAVLVDAIVFIHHVRTGANVRAATIMFYLSLAILTGTLLAICWMTGERPRWRWGERQAP